MNFTKPSRLVEGDTVALISPSWGAPSIYPDIFERGVKELENLGLKTKEFPTARMNAEMLYENPMLRAEDVVQAFADPDVKAIVTSIGGDDSVRILDHVDWGIIQKNPKIFMGFSDTTTLLVALNMGGLVTFHGPSIMAGLAQINAFPKWREHIKTMLFINPVEQVYEEFCEYAEGYPNWSDLSKLGEVLPKRSSSGWRWLQGERSVEGRLFGGCIEVLEFLKGTKFWPRAEFWNDKIVFFETSEETPPVENVRRMLRNYGVQGVFERANALLFGRAHGYAEPEKQDLERAIIDVVTGEFGCSDLPIVANMDFGHTVPQFILPLGVTAQLDCRTKTFRLVESALKDAV